MAQQYWLVDELSKVCSIKLSLLDTAISYDGNIDSISIPSRTASTPAWIEFTENIAQVMAWRNMLTTRLSLPALPARVEDEIITIESKNDKINFSFKRTPEWPKLDYSYDITTELVFLDSHGIITVPRQVYDVYLTSVNLYIKTVELLRGSA